MGHAKQVVVNHVTAVDSLLNSHPVVRRFAAFGDHRSYLRRGTEAEIETGTDPKLSGRTPCRSEEHTSELQSLMRISYAVFCLNKKKKNTTPHIHNRHTDHTSRE